ncbi:hypothetical protein [Paenibacillus sp. GP183]|uniref:hypothetical protein n=1 Tax=Paenibacillus sp. GP183 TaxID=1882751 RepID=UPI0008998F1B|nr:hypothetical protein [Paenibacillus sp. GP183]SED10208.1 hypothetical protein SAMN05443246_5716 [Paenibacillus sp. GP183]
MGKLYQFPAKYKKRPDLKDLFVNDEVDTYYKYFTDSDDWQIEGKRQTLYGGYPDVQPCDPVRSDMVWYVNHQFDYQIRRKTPCFSHGDIRQFALHPFRDVKSKILKFSL